MITYEPTVTCDECKESTFESGLGDTYPSVKFEAKRLAGEKGWICGDDKDYCPECASEKQCNL